MTKDEVIALIKTVRKLAFDLRTDMTSVTRYVKHEQQPGQDKVTFVARNEHYKELALKAVEHILECLNSNPELTAIERLKPEEIEAMFVDRETIENIFYDIDDAMMNNHTLDIHSDYPMPHYYDDLKEDVDHIKDKYLGGYYHDDKN